MNLDEVISLNFKSTICNDVAAIGEHLDIIGDLSPFNLEK